MVWTEEPNSHPCGNCLESCSHNGHADERRGGEDENKDHSYTDFYEGGLLGEPAPEPASCFQHQRLLPSLIRQTHRIHSVLSFSFAASMVCHCILLGASAPPRLS